MADISTEIAAFQSAVYGEDVRTAMVDLANKVNNESSAAAETVDDLESALTDSAPLSAIASALVEKNEISVALQKNYYYSTNTGEKLYSQQWMCSPSLIPVVEGYIYRSGVNNCLIHKYDESFNSLGFINSNNITIPVGCKYISLTYPYSESINTVTITVEGTLKNAVDANVEDTEKLMMGTSPFSSVTYPLTLNPKKLMNENGTIVDYNTSSYVVSNPVTITDEKFFMYTGQVRWTNGAVAFYDSNDNPIKVVKSTDGEARSDNYWFFDNYIVSVPDNAVTVRVCAMDYATPSLNSLNGFSSAELVDLRKAYDNNEFKSAGEAVRNQIGNIMANVQKEKLNISITPGRLMNPTTGVITAYGNPKWQVSDYIPVVPGETYYINTFMDYYNGMLGAYDEDGNTVEVFSPDIGTQIADHQWILDNYKYTIPERVVKIAVAWHTEGGSTYPCVVYNGDHLQFPPIEDDVEEIVEEAISHHDFGNNEVVSIDTSDKIGFFGNSYMNGYTIRTHHCFDNMSMWSDYLFYNYGKSGDDVLETLMRINRNETFLGTVPVQNWNITYGVLAMHTNDGALFASNPETFYQNCKKVCEAIRAMGATPILGTEHHMNQMYYGAQHLADEEGYEFWDWGKTANAMRWFTPFMQNGHPATRTHWSWTYGMLNFIDALPRPMKSIKLFRKRPDTGTSLDDLKYNSLIERSQRFVEIYTGNACLTKATEKYFDRLNNGLTAYESVDNEYQKLQSHTGSVSFGTHALIEGILPYAKKGITALKMTLSATGVTSAYIRRVSSMANPLPDQRYIAFGVTAGESLLTHGTQFTITGGVFNDNILGTYIVDQVVNGYVVTTTSSSGKTTSGTDNPTTNLSGVTLKGSYDYPSADYMLRYDKPLCEWDAITINSSGETDLISYLKDHVDYDKVSILLIGSSITISDVYFNVSGSVKKNNASAKKAKVKKNGTSIITSNLLDDGTSWTNISSIPKYTPVVSAVDGTTVDPLPTGVTTVRVLSEGDTLSQNLLTSNIGQDSYHVDRIQVRIIARYFPRYINSDTAWNSTEIYEGSYDCAEMSVYIEGTVKCASFQVGASWNEFIAEFDYLNLASPKSLRIKCDNKSLQIAKVEAVVVT